MHKIPQQRNRWLFKLIATIWVGGIVAGGFAMFRHEFTAGETEPAPQELPKEFSKLGPKTDAELTLIMAVHPDCPCTSASIEQLDRFLTSHPEKTQAVAFFWTDPQNPDPIDLSSNAYWSRLSKMKAARIYPDPGGQNAAKLGALVSGAVAAYDANGKLRFQGGLTATRGHAGPSPSIDVLTCIAEGREICGSNQSPNFGCSLN